MDRTTFFERLRRSRLLAEADLEQTASRFGDELDSQAIADVLVQEGKLTEFQSRQVCSGDTQPLSLGQYRLLDELGRGGMGRVYKALHTMMGRVVALKVISPELVSDPVALEWFRREVRASTQLHHPNIVMAYDANEDEGLHFLVMEYVHGITLDLLVKQNGPLPIPHACALMRQAALGMQHAHDKGMVHRDIKPSNLLVPYPPAPTVPHKGGGSFVTPSPLVGDGGSGGAEVLVKILDFGLARLHGKNKSDTIAVRGEAGVLGTPDYIAPEQSRDIHAADIRSDLYSLGCVFYFALAGRVPFPGDNAMEKLVKHLIEQPDPLEEIRPDVPPAVAAFVRRLMAKDPADRYQTPAELVHDLEAWDAEQPKLAPVTQIATEPLRRPSAAPARSVAPYPQSEPTCVLANVEVFVPSQRDLEQSGPSLLEPEWKYAPTDKRKPVTRDTVSLSSPESASKGTAEATALEETPLPLAAYLDSGIAPHHAAASQGISAAPDPLPPVDCTLLRLWPQWADLVETIVTGHGSSRVSDNAYRTLHALLLQACRNAIDECPVPERRAFYEECLSIAQPWFKLQAFVRTDEGILDSLLQRCRQIEIELNYGKTSWKIRQTINLILLAFTLAGAALWWYGYGRLWLPLLLHSFQGNLSVSSLRSAWSFVRAHPPLLVGLLFPILFVFSLVRLSRSSRS